jgi:hypothetical protein
MKIKVGDLESEIYLNELSLDTFEVDFGRVLMQFKKQTFGYPFLKNGYRVINAVDGYGNNCKKEFENEDVIIIR